MLTCKTPTGEAECEAIANVSALGSKMFSIYGIGKLSTEIKDMKAESVRFFLYPRNIDNQTYFNYSVPIEGSNVDLVLYYAEKFIDYGLRVTDLKCYERIVDMFSRSIENHVVRLESDLLVKPEVSLIGEILCNDKTVQKRWLYGYGWGYPYYGGWGYGGYGYGGLWGWGK